MIQNRESQPLFSESIGVFDKLLSLHHLRDLYKTASSTDGFHRNLLAELEVRPQFNNEDLARIPQTGPLVVVANHPFGMLEGSLLGSILPKVRQDYKIMTNQLLACMPELESNCIFVDAFQNKNSRVQNGRGLRESVRWLRDGHMLVIFPAGEVSHWTLRNKAVADPEWNTTVARLIRMTGAAALPLYFKGANSVPFHLLGMVHPKLRTVQLPHELFNKRGSNIEIRIGSVIPFDRIAEIPNDTEATSYLRWRTYLLSRRGETGVRVEKSKQLSRPIAAKVCSQSMAADLHALASEHQLENSKELAVYLAGSHQIPNVLKEIGRLREVTFREVGEGTGQPEDLDQFDTYYQHLVLWSKTNREVVGAYRVGNSDQITTKYGVKGLYTNTLFHYDPAFFREIGPALELGRSFVRKEYQKRYGALLALWKGLGRYVSRHPEAPVLFGAVSISNDYNPASRQLVARFLEEQMSNEKLAKLVKARQPFPLGRKLHHEDQSIRSLFADRDRISEVVSEIESDRKGLPILLTQYLKLGGKILGSNLDPRFADALDGLVLVDLRNTQRGVLDRYMGKESAANFLSATTRTLVS